MMKNRGYILEKIRLIYIQPLTYILWVLHLGFMVVYQKFNHISSMREYCEIFWMDYYLWMIVIPLITATHRIGIFNVSYYSLSRCKDIRVHIRTDMIVMIISTLFLVITGMFVPISFIQIFEPCLIDKTFSNQIVLFMYVFVRYSLMAILVQLIIYILFFSVTKIQQNSFAVPAMPFILFVISALPTMIFSNNRFILEVLNYSAGGIIYGEDLSFNYIISVNVHVFLQVLLVGGMLHFMKNHMEFLEYENKSA